MSFFINENRVVLNEPLVDIEKIFDLSNVLKEIKNDKIILEMKNNYSLPSTIIGQLSFLRNNGKDIEIWVYDELLFSIFKDLGLSNLFNVLKK